MHPKLVPIGLIALMAGCASSYSPQAQKIQEAHRSEVRGCDDLGEVHGTASGFHWSTGEAMHSARNRALEAANERGASHVVWQHTEDDLTPRVRGQAYRCSSTGKGG